ncbi:MAG TPA: hypothetical protein VN847_11505 [Streptosporangiaceae bacterium]|nr:hypothetical protein [Streptosporangiaceae bacterium]
MQQTAQLGRCGGVTGDMGEAGQHRQQQFLTAPADLDMTADDHNLRGRTRPAVRGR